jgi:hypothetical protein
MDITGKLIQKLPQQTGQGKGGAWVKQDFILETADQYPRKVCIALWGERARDIDSIQIGETVKAYVNVESREFNGKWYTDVKAWKIEAQGATAASSSRSGQAVPPSIDEVPPIFDGEMMPEEGDLPF